MGPLGFIIRNFGAIYALVMTAIHAAEEAPADGAAKRQAAASQIAASLASIFSLTGKAQSLVGDVIGGMIDVYVGVKNVLEGHGWYGGQTAAPAQPHIADAANTLTQATQQIRQTDVSGSGQSAPGTPTGGSTK